MCASDFGQKMKETCKCDLRHEFPDNHKQKMAHLIAPHEKEAQPMSLNTSSIQGGTFLMNQARSQGSTDPPKVANRIKKGPTHP